jgi:hypothetical protein
VDRKIGIQRKIHMLSVQDRRIRVLKSNMWVGQENYLLQRKVYEKDCGYTGEPEDHRPSEKTMWIQGQED